MTTTRHNLAPALLDHAQAPAEVLAVSRRGDGPDLEAFDAEAYGRDPALYALTAMADGAGEARRARILFQLLAASRRGFDPETRAAIDRVIRQLMAALPADVVITTLLGLRRARANHKHATRAALRWVLDHPHLEDMAIRRRPALADVLEHALGRDVARACARLLAGGEATTRYVHRHLLRHTRRPERAMTVVPFLFRVGPPPAVVGMVGYHMAHEVFETAEVARERPRTVTATNRGDIAATLVHLYRGGPAGELRQALDAYVARAARGITPFEGRLAVVLDASASTRGYGDREHCVIAQSLALKLVLERVCADLRLVVVGGAGDPIVPDGATDLASGLIEAAREQPDVVAIITDGYENVEQGDLARVARALPGAGVDAPVLVCLSLFSAGDDRSERRPAPELAELGFWHELDFGPLVLRLLTAARGGRGEEYLRAALEERLASAHERREVM